MKKSVHVWKTPERKEGVIRRKEEDFRHHGGDRRISGNTTAREKNSLYMLERASSQKKMGPMFSKKINTRSEKKKPREILSSMGGS